MIIRVQFVKVSPNEQREVVYSWAIYPVDERKSFMAIFNDLKEGKLSCGNVMDISWANEDSLLTSTMGSSIIPSQDTMQMTPSFLSPQDVKTKTALYIQFECSPKVTEETECITYENIEFTCNRVLPIKSNLVNVLMKRKESFTVEISVASPTQDTNQYINSLFKRKQIRCSCYKKFLWSVDAHYAKLNALGLNFPESIKGDLNYNNPDKHKHSAPKFNRSFR